MLGQNIKKCLFILTGLTLAAACQPAEEEVLAPVIRPVKLVTVVETSNEFNISFPATIQASQSSTITFQVNGLLQQLPVIEGAEVKRGDVIARLDQRDFRNQLNQAQATFDNADSEYQRALRLAAQDAISRSVVEQRKSQSDVARAQLDTAQKAFNDTTLRAPFDGVVAQIHVENFQNVSAQAAIVTLQSGGELEAVIDAPAQLIARIPELEPGEISVTLDAAPEVSIAAEFKEAAAQSDPTLQTFKVGFTFAPPDNLFVLPGMTGRVSAQFLYTGDAIDLGVSIPEGAIMSDGSGQFVWVLDETNMTVARRDIEIAPERFEADIAVLDGLTGGEIIVGAGASYLSEGTQVRAWTPGE